MWKNGMVFFLSHFLLLLSLGEVGNGQSNLRYSRDDFPSSFVFGAGTSAYQVEGAAAEDGRTPSIWDTFTHSGKMADNSTADIASDGYHRYKIPEQHQRISLHFSPMVVTRRNQGNDDIDPVDQPEGVQPVQPDQPAGSGDGVLAEFLHELLASQNRRDDALQQAVQDTLSGSGRNSAVNRFKRMNPPFYKRY